MTIEVGPIETKLNDRGMVTIPAEIRRQLNLDAGDKLQWTLEGEGRLQIEVVRQREGVFDDFDPVDGPETDAVQVESEFGSER